jgi:hypothetical protein
LKIRLAAARVPQPSARTANARRAASTKNRKKPRKEEGGPGRGGELEVPGSTEKKVGQRYPRLLLSNHDLDPTTGYTSSCDLQPSHPPIWQRDEDKDYNIWWLNTVHPFATEAMRRGGDKSPWFRSYHLFGFQQMIQIEALRLETRRQAELNLEAITSTLLKESQEFLYLPIDLANKLLEP